MGHDGQGQATLPKRRSLVHLVIFHGAVTVPCHGLLWLCGRRVGCRWDQRVTRRFRIGRAPMMFGFVQSWWTKILRLHRDRRSRHSVIVTKQANDGIKTTRPRPNVTTTTTGERAGTSEWSRVQREWDVESSSTVYGNPTRSSKHGESKGTTGKRSSWEWSFWAVCVCSGEENHVTRDRESPLWEENKKSREGGVTLFDTEFVRNGSIAYASVTI